MVLLWLVSFALNFYFLPELFIFELFDSKTFVNMSPEPYIELTNIPIFPNKPSDAFKDISLKDIFPTHLPKTAGFVFKGIKIFSF